MPATERLQPASERDDDLALRSAAERLRAGELVVLPTETVYGVAARAGDARAMARLRELKGREAEKPFTLAFADAAGAFAKASAPGPAKRLAERFWPGPLTLVLPKSDGPRGETVGLRVPGHAGARAVLRLLGEAVALPSANPAGLAPAVDAAGALAYFDGQVEAVLDGGPAALGQASTVVRVLGARVEVLREGILSAADVRRAATRHVLFVCSGNTCRSPMAEALLKAALARRHGLSSAELGEAGYVIGSAGLHAVPGDAVSAGAERAMAGRGLDVTRHRASRLTRELLDAQDLVFVMTNGLLQRLRGQASHPERIRLLDPGGRDVPDPFGGPDPHYEACAALLERHVERIAEQL